MLNIRYLDLSLYQTSYLVSSTFSLISLMSPFGISNSAILNFHYVEQFSCSLQSFFDCLPSAIRYHTVHFRHTNVNNCIDKSLFGSLFFLFFQHCPGNIMSSVRRKLNVKSLSEKMSGFEKLKKRSSNKDVGKKYDVPCCEAKFG